MARLSEKALQVQEMHNNGMTYEEIGRALGISKQAAHQRAAHTNVARRKGVKGVIYVGLRNWMIENNVTMLELSHRIYMSNIRETLVGISEPGKHMIDAILKITGLTYEECFKETEENDQD